MPNRQTFKYLLIGMLGFCAAATAQAQTAEDSAAIRQTALDYIDGWYTGDAERMERALHPELAKRIAVIDSKTGQSRFDSMGAMTLVQSTRVGYGKQTPEDRRLREVTILDVFENAASVKIVASDWIDYLHMVRWNGKWKIVNVLWELKPRKAPPEKAP